MVLLHFKPHDVGDSEYIRERFYSLMEHFTHASREKLLAIVHECTHQFHGCLSLRGNESCLRQYKKLSLAMEDLYSPYASGFDAHFPAKMHRCARLSQAPVVLGCEIQD